MELCLDNTFTKNCIDTHASETSEEEIQEKLVDAEGNDVPEASGNSDTHVKTDIAGNYIATNLELSDIADSDKISDLLNYPRDSGVADMEAEAENKVNGSEESDSGEDTAEEKHCDDIVKVRQENWYPGCVIGIADCAEDCVSDDMVDGCVLTSSHDQDFSDAVICSSRCERDDENYIPKNDLDDDDDDEEEEEEEEDSNYTKIGSPTVAWHSFPGTLLIPDDAEAGEKFEHGSDDIFHGFTNPALKDILEEENSSVGDISIQVQQSKVPAALKEICHLQLTADSYGVSQNRESSFVVRDTLVISAGETGLKYSSGNSHDFVSSVEAISVLSSGALPADEFKRPGDEFVSTQTSVYHAVDGDKSTCHPNNVVVEAVTGLPPVAKEPAPSGDFKEPPAVVMRTKSKSKRVDSIRKSLIKLGSFGKEHGNGKTKSKKEKDKTKNEVQDKHLKVESESAIHGHPGGSTSEPVPGCIQQGEHSALKQTSSENLIQAPTSASPSAQRKRISNPLAVDAEQLQICSAQRQSTMLLMYQQAEQEYMKKSEEFYKSPTASNRSVMDAQGLLVGQLKAQLDSSSTLKLSQSHEAEIITSKHDHASELTTMIKVPSLDMSIDSACFLEEKRDSLAGLPSSSNALSSSHFQRHKKTDSLGCPNRLEAAKTDSSLTRSHSDSFKKNRKEVDDNLRQGNSSDDISKLKMLAARSSICKRHAEGSGNTETEHSNNSSDSAIDQISPTSDKSSVMAPGSLSSSSLNNRGDIMAIDDQEFESDEENFNMQGGPFSDINTLLKQPAHLAVFLHYLILNSDPSPLLFYLITESYPQGSLKEMRKWAYEIFSSFLVEKAPLKIHVDELTVEIIHNTLVNRHDKEDVMRGIFSELRDFFQPVIVDLLGDFRSKQALGLGSLYGDHHLTDKLDAAEQAKVIESTLWKHFEKYMQNEDQERNAAMAAALAFLFKHFGYANAKNNLLERCSVFNAKEKTKFQMFSKPSKKATFHRGHQLLHQQYFTMTYCVLCQNLLCGVGTQGFQCQKCDSNFHKICMDNVKEPCSGKKMPRLPPVVMEKPKPHTTTTVFGSKIKLKRKQSSNASSSSAVATGRERLSEENNLALSIPVRAEVQTEEDSLSFSALHNKASDKGEPPRSADDTKSSPTLFRSRSPSDAVSSDEKQNFTYSDVITDNLKMLSLIRSVENGHTADAVTSAGHSFSDSDLETEADLPSLDSVISKEQFKKMKPKEKKRQEVINELFYTERAHVRNLKVMHRLFYQPMRTELPSDFVNHIFPNIDEMIEVHGNLNKDFKQKRKESENAMVGDFANVLVSHFSGEKGIRFKTVCASFCRMQSQSLEMLKLKQRKDPKLAALLQDAALNSLCRRLELKDFLPTAMQRLTKYPLLIENLLKYTQVDSNEYQLLQLAIRSSKEILNHVNKAVQDYENHLKLVELQKKVDKRPIENSSNPVVAEFKNLDMARHTLLYDGSLTWRLSRERLINLHVVLLDDILLLLQKQDEKLVLRCQSTLIVAGKEDTKMTHSPIIKLSNVLIKPVATDKCAFFLVNTSDVGPQIYDLVAGSKDEKNKWCNRITDGVEAFKLSNPVIANIHLSKYLPVAAPAPRKSAEEDAGVISHALESEVAIDESSVYCPVDPGHEALDITANGGSLQGYKQEFVTAEDMARQESSSSDFLDRIQYLDECIRKSFLQKREILSKLGQFPEEDSDFVLGLPSLPDPAKNSDPKDVLLTMVTMSDCLAQHVNVLLNNADEQIAVSEAILEEDDPPPLPPRSPILPTTEALPPPLPPRLYRALPNLPLSQLTDYCTWMNGNLSYLMRYYVKLEEEKSQLIRLLNAAHEEFNIRVNGHEIEDNNHLIGSVSTDLPTEHVEELSLCPEFVVQNISKDPETERKVSGEDDRDIGVRSSDEGVVETCVATAVECITRIADDDRVQGSEDSVIVVTEAPLSDHVIDNNDLSSYDVALNAPADNFEVNSAT